MEIDSQLTINGHKEKMREIEEQLRKHPNSQIEFSPQDIQDLIKNGKVPKELGDWFLKDLEEKAKKHQDFKEFIKKHPEIPEGEHCKSFFKTGPLSATETTAFYESASLNGQLFLLLQNQNLLRGFVQSSAVKEILEPLFKNVDQATEFGIARFIADQMNHLPSLLNKIAVEPVGENEYVLKAEKPLQEEGGKRLSFSHPITAPNHESALEIAEKVVEKLLGFRHKMWQACWVLANRFKKTQFTAPINDLMKACYPTRNSDFSSKEREEFYEELRLLRQAEFTLSGNVSLPGKKSREFKYNIPILRVGGAVGKPGEIGGAPDQIFLDLCAITPLPTKPHNKMLFIAAPIKKKSLELNAKDSFLSFFIQVRKNQVTAGEKNQTDHYDFKIKQLIEEAALIGTFESNPTVGKKRLVEKLERAKEKGIFKSFVLLETSIRIYW